MHFPFLFIFWFILWFTTWGLFNLTLPKKGISYHHRFYFSILFFLIVSLFPLLFLHRSDTNLIQFNIDLLFFPPLFLLFGFITYFSVNRRYAKKVFDYRYLLSKPFDIFFQQTMIVFLLVLLQRYIPSKTILIFTFALFFLLVHTPILFVKKNSWGKILLLASFVAGLIFPFLILNLSSGVIFSYLTHLLFYLIIGTIYKILIYRRQELPAA